ncbi:Gag protein [Phytophthora palmivora]|uniref:Gag protein n=1 Tax=Phytophthora palmivora TaxID=4796 RepID=A0A2P4XK93_9STRA|nr:Gag protein [Phytophthora palmivora]
MVGIFGGDALRSLAAATPAEQVERIETFDMYKRGLIAHMKVLQTPVAELKSAQPKPLRLKVNSYEGKERENLHFWVREVELDGRSSYLDRATSGNPLPEHIKVTVFMDDLKVGPSRTQLFRVHANTMEEAIQITLQEEYSHRQARTPTSVWQDHNASTGAVQEAPATGASTVPVPMELGTVVQSSIRCYGCGKLGHMQRAPCGRAKEVPFQT